MKNRTLSIHQEHEVLLKLESAGLNDKIAQMIIQSKSNQLAKRMIAAIVEKPVIDPRFELMKSMQITIPTDYNHSTQLATFAKNHEKEFYYYNGNITDQHFSKATNQLQPGKTYTVDMFAIKQTVQSEDCMNLLKSQHAILAGAQGASLVYQLAKQELPKGKYFVSFDERDALWKDSDGDHRVPYVNHYSGGGFEFGLGCFGRGWGDDCVVFCFRDSE